MKFEYKNLKGDVDEVSFSDLEVIAEGPIPLSDDWQGDRVNRCKSLSIFIEFRSGPEINPGHQPSEAVQVTKEYILEKYGVDI